MTDAHALHHEILTALRDHRAAEHRLAVLLTTMREERLYCDLGFSTLHDYAREALDLEPRKTRALLQIGRCLPDLPALDRAFAAGEIGWTKARDVLRVATPDTAAAWVERARDVSSRELERQVLTAVTGDLPPVDPGEAMSPARQRLVFELEATDAQTVRDALAVIRASLGRVDVDDGVLLAMLAQRTLHDAPPEGAPEAYRKVISECPGCAANSGVGVEVTDTVGAEAECDHELVIAVPGPYQGQVGHAIPPRRRRAVLARDGYRCVVPGCSCRIWLHVHHLHHRSHGGDHAEINLVTLCSPHHRQVHLGLLAIWRDPDGRLAFRFPDGRTRGPRGPLRRGAWAGVAVPSPRHGSKVSTAQPAPPTLELDSADDVEWRRPTPRSVDLGTPIPEADAD